MANANTYIINTQNLLPSNYLFFYRYQYAGLNKLLIE